jgi:hypothetical protein
MANGKIQNIDKEQFEKLCGIQCTQEEIACWFMVSVDTLEVWTKKTYSLRFSEIFNQKRKRGHIALRRKQMDVALSGNVPMLIFLGKNYLGQTDGHMDVNRNISDIKRLLINMDGEECGVPDLLKKKQNLNARAMKKKSD